MKSLKPTLVLASALSLTTLSQAQVTLQNNKENALPYTKNEVGIEVGGNSLLYSAYYQRALYRKGNTQFNIRIGGSLFPGLDNYSDDSYSRRNFTTSAYIVPNLLFFRKRHAWEVGLGVNVLANFQRERGAYYSSNSQEYDQRNAQVYFLMPQVGYRAYFKNSKFYMRAAVCTYVFLHYHDTYGDWHSSRDVKVLPWAAFGFGYAFGK